MEYECLVHDIKVINDSLLTFWVNIPIYCKNIKPQTFMFYVYNKTDGKMAFITKIYLIISIKSNIQNTNITLFPNPVIGGEFTLEFDEIITQNSTLIIFNEIGQELISEQITDGIKSKTINVADLSKGIYFYNIITDAGKINAGKFIIK